MNKRILIGNKMSNVFFNWAQHERFTPEEKMMMKDLQTQWDESRPTKRAADFPKAAAHPANRRVRKSKVIRPAKSG